MDKLPESEHCPSCGSPDHITVHPAWAGSFRISLRNNRQCADCDARYSPPTPIWLTAAAILIGGVVFVGSLGAARLIPDFLGPRENAARIGVGLVFFLLAVGGMAIVVSSVLKLLSCSRRIPERSSAQSGARSARLRGRVGRDNFGD